MKINFFSVREIQNCNAVKNNYVNNKFVQNKDVFVKSTPIAPSFKGSLEENISRLKSFGFSNEEILKLSESNINRLINLLSKPEIQNALKNGTSYTSDLLSVEELNENKNNLFASITDNKKVLNYIEKGNTNISEIVEFVSFSDEEDTKKLLSIINGKKFEKLIESNKISPIYDLSKCINLNENQTDNLIELLNEGITGIDAISTAKFEGDEYERAKELYKKGISASNLKNFVSLDNNLYNRVLELIANNASEADLFICLDMDEKIYTKALTLIKEGFSAIQSYRLALGEKETYEKALEYKYNGLSPDGAYQICNLEKDEQNKAFELAKNGMNTFNACFIVKTALPNEYEKILELTKLGVEYYSIDKIIKTDDIIYQKTINLIKNGLESNTAYNLAQNDEETYEKVLLLLNKNVSQNAVSKLCSKLSNKDYINEINVFTDKNIHVYDADKIITDMKIKNLYNDFIVNGYSEIQSSILANIKNIENFNCEDVKNLIDNISNFYEKEEYPTEIISEYLNKNPKLDIKSFNEYISGIDFKKLFDFAPQIKNYSKSDFIKFANYHFYINDTKLNEHSLKFCDDFTHFIENNYINATEMDNILTIFPLTERNIGEIPSDWIDDNVNEQQMNEIRNKVSQLFNEFRINRNLKVLEREMRNLLKKEVKISEIASGNFGTTYKISMPNAIDTCLKIYFDIAGDSAKYMIHGVLIEPQTAIFANNNSNEFVKTFLARVTNKKQKSGFILTQFLNGKIQPIKTNTDNNNIYDFIPNDTSRSHNKINGIIFDFGAVEVQKKDGTNANWTLKY